MAVQGNLYVRQLDESGKSIKWEISGDAQSRIDVVFSEWIVVEEMTQAPPFRRVMEIVDTNGMCAFGPALTENPLLLGGKGFHIAFFHPRLQGLEASEMPRMMETIPTG
ncbi:hypothetical protein [Mycobacteroides abscessus]|uniref:hypothetical protein n=1 Tax=Mycobacteroides abscessus TaxID=36809 RepID=UPI0009B6B8CA|nr:hypothetical protein [Mycobacteroides abscessus]MDO2978032.1 hypothetical protein [Mycobacteroides abscessus subsp. abscessus]MDO3288705.1 hypothetical protein [Mycobacteroides abscessus subsp. abscessus]MDO3293783.1 hypothetical protein [Mycobacteroides abscessus subsp. abscessus]